MRFTVPSVEALLASFPEDLKHINGRPDYDQLNHNRMALQANAATVDTTLGGGAHGYLGLIMSTVTYATVSAIAFAPPGCPAPLPAPTATDTQHTITERIRLYEEQLREWETFSNVQKASSSTF